MDRLAQEGIRYERCYTTIPITLPAHASMMTGLYPFEHGVRDNGRFRLSFKAVTLAEVLKGQGYRTGAVIGAFVLDRRFGLAQGFDHYDDEMPSQKAGGRFSYSERTAEAITDRAVQSIGAFQGAPFFLWAHYFDPHAAYNSHSDDPELRHLAPYDAEIGFADRHIGRLLDHVDRVSGDRGALVILTADHGEGLGEHGELSHGHLVYDSTLHVPLLVRFPDRAHAGTSISQPVSVIDLFPSLVAWLDIPVEQVVTGRPLPTSTGGDDGGEEAPFQPIYFENYSVGWNFGCRGLRGVVLGANKWIDANDPERFDLSRDPHETVNHYSPEDEISRELEDICNTLVEEAPDLTDRFLESQHEMSGPDAARLGSLGYVTDRTSGQSDLPTTGPDPRQIIEDIETILEAHELINRQAHLEAAEKLMALLQTVDYLNPRILVLLAAMAGEDATRELVVPALLPYLDRELSSELKFVVAVHLGEALARMEQFAEAIRVYRIAAEIHPKNGKVLKGLRSLESRPPPASEIE
jgi:hypothetical protein